MLHITAVNHYIKLTDKHKHLCCSNSYFTITFQETLRCLKLKHLMKLDIDVQWNEEEKQSNESQHSSEDSLPAGADIYGTSRQIYVILNASKLMAAREDAA